MELTDSHRRYWRKNRIVIAALLAIWFAVTFVVPFFARELSFNFFGWPFSFWMGAQGSVLVYVLIIGFYAWYMNRLDVEHGVEDETDDPDGDESHESGEG
ncbi:MAG: DUF4212 domain-containing protein [Comamonadaceae bacterium]|nr:MAG: DUF4212 domain-containing protein [Comamonadaceae bacterium]